MGLFETVIKGHFPSVWTLGKCQDTFKVSHRDI